MKGISSNSGLKSQFETIYSDKNKSTLKDCIVFLWDEGKFGLVMNYSDKYIKTACLYIVNDAYFYQPLKQAKEGGSKALVCAEFTANNFLKILRLHPNFQNATLKDIEEPVAAFKSGSPSSIGFL